MLVNVRIFCFCIFLLSTNHSISTAHSEPAQIENSAVILMYHNISDDTHPDTSVSPEMFKKHMQFIKDNEYTVWPLLKALMALKSGKPMPSKIVVLTFDDAYRSVYSEAFPILKDKGWPFTVFVTTNYINDSYRNFMNWGQLREIQLYGGDVGNHSLSHAHFVRQYKLENEIQCANVLLMK